MASRRAKRHNHNNKKPRHTGHNGGLTHISVYLREVMEKVKEQEPAAPSREG